MEWCAKCQLEHGENGCPVSSVEQIEGYQQHLERKFWEQCFIAAIPVSGGMDVADVASEIDVALVAWRKRWGKK